MNEKRIQRINSVVSLRQRGIIVILEDIHDPHNAAAIMRTCDGLGIQEVYVIIEKEEYYNIKKIGKVSSSSANKWLTFHIFRSTQECFRELKKQGYVVALTILNKEAEDASCAKLTDKKLALVIGNEHRGVSPVAQKLADRKLYLPMAGFVESFNVSVSAALFLYEIIRQRSASGKNYHLSTKEATKLLADFKKR